MWRSIVPLLLLLGAVPVHPVTVQEIPNPRPAGWSVDLTGRIPSATLQEIDQLGDEVKAKTGSEIAVVVVGSLNGAASRNFAVRLFNAWRIGDPARKNGVLIFTALDDHKAEVVLGSGIDNAQTRRTSDEIMQSEMVPRFRAGDPAAAVLAGAREHARRILGVEMTAAPAPNSAPQPPQKAVSQPAREPVPSPGGIWIVIVLLMFASVLAVLFIILWLLWRAVRFLRRKHRERILTSDDSDSSSDPGFSGGSSDGGGSSGQW